MFNRHGYAVLIRGALPPILACAGHSVRPSTLCMHVCMGATASQRKEMREKWEEKRSIVAYALIVRISLNLGNLFAQEMCTRSRYCRSFARTLFLCVTQYVINRLGPYECVSLAGRATIIRSLQCMHFVWGIANVILYIALQMLTALVYSHMNNVRSVLQSETKRDWERKRSI